MTKIVFLGGKTVGADCLSILLESGLDFEIAAVGASSRGQEIIEIARREHLLLIEDPDDIPSCDIIISVQYHRILKVQHLERARTLATNLHMAPLPEYRGCNQFSAAILHNDPRFGVTLHRMDPGIDSGDILFERRFDLPSDIWVAELVELAHRHSVELFRESIGRLISGDYTVISQDSLVAERGTMLIKRSDIDRMKEIDLSWSEERIERVVRATSMPGFPPPFTFIDGKKVELAVCS